MSIRQEDIWAEAYRRNLLPPEKRALYEEAMRRQLVKGPERSLGQRLLDNLEDGFQRSGIGNILRSADPGADGLASSGDLFSVDRGSPLDFILDHTAGQERGFARENGRQYSLVDSILRPIRGQSLAGTPQATQERARRQLYAAKAASDPIKNPLEFGAYLAGQVGGGAVSPENLVGGGSVGAGSKLTTRLLARAGEQALVAGVTDVGLQAGDIGAGIEDEYNFAQTVGSASLGGLIGPASDAMSTAIVRPISGRVRRAYTDPVTPIAHVEPSVHATGVVDPASLAAGMSDPPPAAITGNATATIPDFASVRPVDTGVFARAREAVGEKGVPAAVSSLFADAWRGTQEVAAKLYAGHIDEQHPIVRLRNQMLDATEALTGRPENVAPSQDPLKLSRGRYDVFNVGQMDILHGVHDYGTTNVSTPALAHVVTAVGVRFERAGQTVADGINALGKYAAARRALAEWDRFERGEIPNQPTRESRADTESFLAHMDQAQPEFRGLSDDLNAYAQGLLRKKLDSGRISRETYDNAVGSRDFYAPLRRHVEDRPRGLGASANKAAGVASFKGSDRDIVNPILVLTEESYKLAQQVRQNDLNLSIVKMAERLDRLLKAADDDEGNAFIRRVDAPIQKITIGKDEIAAQARDGTPMDPLDDLFNDDIEVFRTGQVNENGRAVLYVWRDGKREAFELQDAEWGQMALDALTSMNKQQAETWVNVFAAGTTFLSRAITREPSFMVANFVRDAFSAWTLTDHVAPFEGLKGVAQELAKHDSSRLYNLAGGISGGEASQAVGSMLKTKDLTELARGFDWTYGAVKMRYASDIKGFLRLGGDAYRLTELTETGTRRQVFNKAFQRAKREGFDEYNALFEAAFTARDYADFGRHGSKVWAARRIITFLNPWAQGIDKLIRTAITDPASAIGRAHAFGGREAALKAILAPLFREDLKSLPVRATDKAALKLAVHAWTRMTAMGVFGLALSALMRDDPDYQNANELNRATHWVIPVGGGVLFRIPKPFEAAFMSNVMERAYEATVGDDPTAWEKMWTGLVELFAPPSGVPLMDVTTGLTTGVDPRTGRPIISDELENLPPELQFEWWTSEMARDLGKQFDVAPANIDFFMKTMGGPYGSYAMGMSNATDPDRPSGSWIDLPVARRFLSPSYRGAQDKREFYDRVGARTSQLARAANGVAIYEKRGQVRAAQEIYNDLDLPGRIFVASQRGEAATDRLNPLVRAKAFAQMASQVIGELHGADLAGDGDPLPQLTHVQRQAVVDQIEKVVVAEMGNAMIATRQPGFRQRNMRDRAALWDELETMAPEIASEMDRRLRRGPGQAYDYAAVMDLWPEVEARIKAEGVDAYLDDLADTARGRSGYREPLGEEPNPFATIDFGFR